LDFILVPDYTLAGIWDKAFQKIEFNPVIYTAAPLLDDPKNKDFDADFLAPSIKG